MLQNWREAQQKEQQQRQRQRQQQMQSTILWRQKDYSSFACDVIVAMLVDVNKRFLTGYI